MKHGIFEMFASLVPMVLGGMVWHQKAVIAHGVPPFIAVIAWCSICLWLVGILMLVAGLCEWADTVPPHVAAEVVKKNRRR